MKAAVIYFTRSGQTRAAAEHIAGKLCAETFELRPAEPYPEEYRAVVNRAMEELRAGTRPELASMPDVSDCDTVLVGSPNWCGTFAAPVATFLAKAPLDGKRVALFCTSGGSGLKNMPRDAERLSPKAVFLPGDAFKNGADIAAMDAWVEQLGGK